MTEASEIIERPLTAQALAERFRALCSDPVMANLPGKIELDTWGRILMTPANNRHGAIQSRLARILASLEGTAMVETSILTEAGVLVADVTWASAPFIEAHGFETPYLAAPELCIEVVSASNSSHELKEKVAAYLGAGANEAWLVYPQSERVEVFGREGLLDSSSYPVSLKEIFPK